jgi:uncharacterized OB-fold protein
MAGNSREFNAASFYAYLMEKRLMGVRCRACQHLSATPRPLCPSCHSRDIEWYEFSGKGRLGTFTCVYIVPVFMGQRGFGRNNPYCSGVVTLEEGPRISGLILGVDASNPQKIKTGIDLVLDPAEVDPEKPSVTFRPA